MSTRTVFIYMFILLLFVGITLTAGCYPEPIAFQADVIQIKPRTWTSTKCEIWVQGVTSMCWVTCNRGKSLWVFTGEQCMALETLTNE
jgi:hypothetical protein